MKGHEWGLFSILFSHTQPYMLKGSREIVQNSPILFILLSTAPPLPGLWTSLRKWERVLLHCWRQWGKVSMEPLSLASPPHTQTCLVPKEGPLNVDGHSETWSPQWGVCVTPYQINPGDDTSQVTDELSPFSCV